MGYIVSSGHPGLQNKILAQKDEEEGSRVEKKQEEGWCETGCMVEKKNPL